MSDTPMTDAEPPAYDGFPSTVRRTFAEQLERKLAQAIATGGESREQFEEEREKCQDAWGHYAAEAAIHDETKARLKATQALLREHEAIFRACPACVDRADRIREVLGEGT